MSLSRSAGLLSMAKGGETRKEQRQRLTAEAQVALEYLVAHREEVISDKSQAYYDWEIKYHTEKLMPARGPR